MGNLTLDETTIDSTLVYANELRTVFMPVTGDGSNGTTIDINDTTQVIDLIGTTVKINGDLDFPTSTNVIKFGGNVGIAVSDTWQSVAIGKGALLGNTNETREMVAIGYDAANGVVQYRGVFIGQEAGKNVTGKECVCVGNSAGHDADGVYLLCLGDNAGAYTTGDNNTSVGANSGFGCTTANSLFMGYAAGQSDTGDSVICIGHFSGMFNSGNDVYAIGYQACMSNTGNDVIAIGYEAGKDNTSANQFIVKQNNIDTTPLIQGDFSTGIINIYGKQLTVVQEATVSLSEAQIESLHTTPVQVIPAPGVGKAIMIIAGSAELTFGTAQYNNNTLTRLRNVGSTSPALLQVDILDLLADKHIQMSLGSGEYIENTAIEIYNNQDAGTSGDSTVKVHVLYTIITL
jgi:hypothetical protein